MKRYSVASRQSVGSPRTARWSEPSTFRRRGPATAASGCASANSTSRSIPSATTQASELSRKKYRPAAARMPVLLPPPMPRFSCSITRTSGNRSRTSATVPSVEPLSTTITSRSRTDARHCSIHGSAFHVTTTTDTSGTAPRHGALRPWGAPVEYLLPEDHGESRQGEQDRHHEEEEAAGEGGVGVDSEIPEEADEERLAHAEAVDRERHEHDEEEQRAEDDVREEREVDAHGAAGRVDREHA